MTQADELFARTIQALGRAAKDVECDPVRRGELAERLGLTEPEMRDLESSRLLDDIVRIAAAMGLGGAEARAMDEFQAALAITLDRQEMLSAAETALRRRIEFDAMVFWLGDRAGGLQPVYGQGNGAEALCATRTDSGTGVVGAAASTRTVEVGSTLADNGYRENAAAFEGEPLLSVLAAPVVHGDSTSVLAIYHVRPAAFDEEDARFVRRIANRLRPALGNAARFASAQKLLKLDPATGLATSAALFEALDAELSRARRTGTPIAVLTAELREAPSADRASLIGEALRDGCREYDVAARMGGSQFAIVLPGCEHEGAKTRAKALGKSLRGAGVDPGGFGIAVYPIDGADAEQLLATAHRDLHSAAVR